MPVQQRLDLIRTKWIMSEGGPLVCIEERLEQSWGGTDELTVVAPQARNDYERACQATHYLERFQVQGGSALILGDAPLDTALWRSAQGQIFVVRIWNCEEDFDLDEAMQVVDPRVFDTPAETLEFSFATSELVIFDSAESGRETQKNCLSFSVVPGTYRILTQPFDPDPRTALVLHRFDRVDSRVA